MAMWPIDWLKEVTMNETVARKATEPQIDPELLAEAQRHLNNVTPNEAVNEALRLLVEHYRERRGRAFDRLQEMVEQEPEHFDFSAIDEADR
jgi:Arc/MetJ family transcription regulator